MRSCAPARPALAATSAPALASCSTWTSRSSGVSPRGGGWRLHGRAAGDRVRARGIGYDYVHVAVDDHTRLAYAEVLDDERGATCAGFLTRAGAFFAAHGVSIQRVLTDNAFAYRHSQAFSAALATLGASPRFIRPRCPWTNGKAERFIRTLTSEWAYRQPWLSTTQRAAALPAWLQDYNTQRPHTALGGHPPITRLSPDCHPPNGSVQLAQAPVDGVDQRAVGVVAVQ